MQWYVSLSHSLCISHTFLPLLLLQYHHNLNIRGASSETTLASSNMCSLVCRMVLVSHDNIHLRIQSGHGFQQHCHPLYQHPPLHRVAASFSIHPSIRSKNRFQKNPFLASSLRNKIKSREDIKMVMTMQVNLEDLSPPLDGTINPCPTT